MIIHGPKKFNLFTSSQTVFTATLNLTELELQRSGDKFTERKLIDNSFDSLIIVGLLQVMLPYVFFFCQFIAYTMNRLIAKIFGR